MSFQIDIDRERCMGSGNCSYWAPNTFDLDDEGLAIVIDPAGDDEDKLRNAERGCPTNAITLTGTGSTPST